MFVCFFVAQKHPPPSQRGMASSLKRFLDHTQRRITVGKTPLDEWSASRKDLYLTTHNTHIKQTSMPPAGIRTHNLSRRAAADLHLRPRGYWDWQSHNADQHNAHLLHITLIFTTYSTCRWWVIFRKKVVSNTGTVWYMSSCVAHPAT